MRIDNVIANPPYGAILNPNFHNRIMNEIKPKVSNCISVMPLSSKVRYKTAEYVGNPFGIAWSNIFVFDMLGNKNEYFSYNEMPLWDKTSNKTLWIRENPPEIFIMDTIKDTTKMRFNIINNSDSQNFVKWVNTSEVGTFFIKYIRTTFPSRYMYNRLWEIYNEQLTTINRK